MPPHKSATVRWSAYIPSADFKLFTDLHPCNGILTALITVGLRRFLDRVETRPDLVEWVSKDIMRHLHDEERSTDNHQVAIRIPLQHYERFMALFPDHGATTWFMRRVFFAYMHSVPSLHKTLDSCLDAILSSDAELKQPTSIPIQ